MRTIFFILILFPFRGISQSDNVTAKIDSLKLVIEKAEHDSTLINAWFSWIDMLKREDTDLTIWISEQIDSLCSIRLEKESFSKEERQYFNRKRAMAYEEKATIFTEKGDMTTGLKLTKNAMECYKIAEKKQGVASCLTRMGVINTISGDFEKAEACHLESIAIKKEKNDSSSLISSFANLGLLYFHWGKKEKAFEYMESGLACAEAVGKTKLISTCLANLGMFHINSGNHDEAIIYIERSIEIATETKNYRALYTNLMNYGVILSNNAEFGKAKNAFDRALEIATEQKNEIDKAMILVLMAELYVKLKDYESSLDYYLSGLKIHENLGDSLNLPLSLEGVGFSYLQLGKDSLGLEYLERSVALSESTGNVEKLARALQSIGAFYQKRKDYDNALEYFNRSLKHYSELDASSGMVGCLNSIADIERTAGNKQKAKSLYQKALTMNLEVENMLAKKISSEGLYKIYKEEGKQISALEMLEIYNEARDSLESESNQRDVFRQEYQFAYEKQALADSIQFAQAQKINEAELAAEKAIVSQQKQRSYFLGSGLLLALLLGGYIFNRYRLVERQKVQIEEANTQLQQLNATKDKFFGIIAHDIRSPIVALEGVEEQMDYYFKNDKKEKLQQLGSRVGSTAKKLNGLLDNLLNWALLQQGVIPYHPESINLKSVSDEIIQMFENNAQEKSLILESEVNPNHVVMADNSAIQTILRNLMSNAIKYSPKGGKVKLSSIAKGDKIFININDTGTGIAAEKIPSLFSLNKKSKKGTSGEKGTGLGLTIVKELTELNRGVLDVKSKLNEGSVFSIGLPVG